MVFPIEREQTQILEVIFKAMLSKGFAGNTFLWKCLYIEQDQLMSMLLLELLQCSKLGGIESVIAFEK